MDELEQLFAFSREIDKEKLITRKTYLTGGKRQENDAEHAWHAAVMTLLLHEYAKEPIDVLRTISMILLHDLVEIDAGDTFAYDEAAVQSQHEREQRAADRIFGLLPKAKGEQFRMLWEEFEAGQTAEARFARAMDNLQPILLNDLTDGKAWRENGVHLHQILRRNAITQEGAPVLWEYALQKLLLPNVARGAILQDPPAKDRP